MMYPNLFAEQSAASAYQNLELDPPPYEDVETGAVYESLPKTPVNYYWHKATRSIEHNFSVDVRLPPPANYEQDKHVDLHPHRNLSLETRANHLRASISIVNSVDSQDACQYVHAFLVNHAQTGSVYARIFDPLLDSGARPRLSIQASAPAAGARVRLGIPRSFRGQLSLHSPRSCITLSKALDARVQPVGSHAGTQTFFVGECPPSRNWRTPHEGEGELVDFAAVSSQFGEVYVFYSDEGFLSSPVYYFYDETLEVLFPLAYVLSMAVVVLFIPLVVYVTLWLFDADTSVDRSAFDMSVVEPLPGIGFRRD
ncbi:hypothetical protein FA95DRAFT_1563830 [Auriscalpium vulgare]|uniref:Uncharacterized protein n=1 Tax=Auriscalpium vulgare TaxID=40419 RepID=A0ACB8RG54_9AGAM|nr:hypothetical protein FA95DRAFT_1563830 [Auriscalpium vulgare]